MKAARTVFLSCSSSRRFCGQRNVCVNQGFEALIKSLLQKASLPLVPSRCLKTLFPSKSPWTWNAIKRTGSHGGVAYITHTKLVPRNWNCSTQPLFMNIRSKEEVFMQHDYREPFNEIKGDTLRLLRTCEQSVFQLKSSLPKRNTRLGEQRLLLNSAPVTTVCFGTVGLDGCIHTRLPNLCDRSGKSCVYKWVASHLSRQKICNKVRNLSQAVTAVSTFNPYRNWCSWGLSLFLTSLTNVPDHLRPRPVPCAEHSATLLHLHDRGARRPEVPRHI